MTRVGLTTQLLIGILAPLMVLGALLHHVQRRALAARVYESIESRTRLAAHAYGAAGHEAMRNLDRPALQRITSELIHSQDELVYAFATGEGGEILASSFQGGFPTDLLPLARKPAVAAMHLDTSSGLVCHAAFPVLECVSGVVHVGLREGPTLVAMEASLLRMDLVFLGFGAAMGLAVGGMLTLLAIRLRQLARRMDDLPPIPGGHDTPLEEDGPREMADLARAFNLVRLQLRVTHDQALETERFATAGRLAAGLVHEMNNPLAGALACVRAIRAGRVPAARMEEYWRMAEESLDRVAAVVHRMASFAAEPGLRDDTGLDLSAIARGAAEAVGGLAAQCKVKLDLELPAGLPTLVGCAPLVEQAFVNVLTNAVQASPVGSSVSFRLLPSAEGIVAEVVDQGPGIRPGLIERLGEPLFPGDRGGPGLGLGLFLVKGTLRRCGGSLDILSGESRGTVVRLQFPLRRPPGGAAPQK